MVTVASMLSWGSRTGFSGATLVHSASSLAVRPGAKVNAPFLISAEAG